MRHVRKVCSSTFVQQSTRNGHMPACAGVAESGRAVIVGQVDISAAVEEYLHNGVRIKSGSGYMHSQTPDKNTVRAPTPALPCQAAAQHVRLAAAQSLWHAPNTRFGALVLIARLKHC